MDRSNTNQSAKELWAQIFARLATRENAAIVDPDHDDTADEEHMRAALAEAGWSSNEIEDRIRAANTDRSGVAATSPGVSPNIEKHLDRLCDDIETAMDQVGLTSHAHLARGVDPVTGPAASMTNVIMTKQGIVTVSSFFFRFCGLIARAFTRTLHLNPPFWESPNYSEKSAVTKLQADPFLSYYWLSIFLSYAVTGTHILTPYKPATRQELLHFEQVARAMELFAISHEYGHHHQSHGRNVEDDPQQHEFEADQFALQICFEVERRPLIFFNPYLSSGAGGIVLLTALEILRSVTQFITDDRQTQSDNHPSVSERLAQFESATISDPTEYARLTQFRTASTRLMGVAKAIVDEICEELTPDMISELRTIRRRANSEID